MQKFVQGLHHIAVFCRDWKETADFYCNVLGFSFRFLNEVDTGPATGFLRIAFLYQNGLNLELLETQDPSVLVAQGAKGTLNHFGLYVTDLDAVLQKIKEDGRATLEKEGIGDAPNVGNEDIRLAFFRGINGERVELLEAVSVHEWERPV